MIDTRHERHRDGWRWLRRGIQWLAVLVVVLVLAAMGLAAYLMPSDPLLPADAIVVISGGGPERLERGIELYREEYAPQLILSGDARDPRSPSNAESMRAAAIKQGIPAGAILVDDQARTTYENATGTRALLRPAAERVILVTSAYHQRRALQAFRSVYGPAVEVLSAPAPVAFFTPWGWWRTAQGRRLFFSETGKLLYVQFTGEHDRRS